MLNNRTYRYDNFIGSFGKYVCVGQCALWRSGLTATMLDSLQLGTLHTDVTGLGSWMAKYYFSPWADKYFETHPSIASENILIPSPERALIESIILGYFDEGVIIEALQNYLSEHKDLIQLYKVCAMFGSVFDKTLDYWIQEAREDNFTCNG